MTDKEKLEKLNKLADAMYYAAQYLTTDASRLRKAMNEYHQFIIKEYYKEEPINYDKLNTMLDDALAKETKESLNERLGISQEERDAIVDKYLYGKEPELVDVDDLPKEEPVSEGLDIDAIKEELYKAVRIYKPNGDFGWGTLYNIAYHFANWQKQQMMKDAVHGNVDYPLIGCDFPNIYPNYRELKDYCDRYNIKDAAKVKLIIFKED